MVYNRDLNGTKQKEFVCLWNAKYDPHNKIVNLALRFLSSKYSGFIDEIFAYYVTNHMSLNKNETSEETQSDLLQSNSENKKVEKYSILVPDYYDQGFLFSNALRKQNFRKQESWEEFRLCPMVNFNITLFINSSESKKEKSN